MNCDKDFIKSIFEVNNFRTELNIFLRLALIAALSVGVITVLYFPAVHIVITDIYNGRSISILNRLITDQSIHPIEYYIKQADHLLWSHIIPESIFTILFGYIILKIFRKLVPRLRKSDYRIPVYEPRLFRYDWLIAVSVYFILTLVYFIPHLSTLQTSLIGPPEDNMQSYWNFWYGHRVIVDGIGSLKYTDMIYYPQGTLLFYHSLSFYNLFLSIPLSQVWGFVASYNMLIMHSFVLAGLGAFFLVRYLTKNSLFAIVAGFLYGFSPFHFAQALHHINISSLQFVPFFILFFIKAIREKSIWNILWAAIFLLLNAICDWNYLIFAGYFMLFSYIYLAVRRHKIVLWDVIIKSSVIIVLGLAPLIPWLYKMITVGLQRPETNVWGHSTYVADLIGIIIPTRYHLLGGLPPFKQLNDLYHFKSNAWESAVYLGIPVMILLILSLKHHFEYSLRYFIASLAFMLMALGAYLRVFSIKLSIALPYALIKFIPFLSNARCPSRFIVYVQLFVILAIAPAFMQLLHDLRQKKWPYLFISSFFLLIFLDYYSFSSSATKVSLPECYSKVAKDSEKWGILDLPSRDARENRYMMNQTLHELPIVQGLISRKIGKSLIDSLDFSNLGIQKNQLVEDKIKYIVFYRDSLNLDSFHLDDYCRIYRQIYSDTNNLLLQVY